MKFQVTRTSTWLSEEKPCEGATKEWYDYQDIRAWKSLDEIPEPLRLNFFNQGTNHRVEGGRVVRTLRKEGWFYEGDLEDFIKEHGPCVVEAGDSCMHVEIYDNYRE